MKRFFLAPAAACALIGWWPGESSAFFNSPQYSQGFRWLDGKALNFMSFNHFHGPLYNYGPYSGPGYAWMFVAQPWCGAYTPAYPASAYGGYPVDKWTNFNYLPYPRTPPGGYGVPSYAPPGYAVPGYAPPPPKDVIVSPPTPLAGPVVSPPASSEEPLKVEEPRKPLPQLPSPKANTPSSTSNYYGGQSPPYFAPVNRPTNR